ncbi:MAG: hypothetical protein HY731_13590 [Candidatus Tectomicrobia bacterium]|nr:hypothetical protein [Candidatus Tectomicrobia bacterium]
MPRYKLEWALVANFIFVLAIVQQVIAAQPSTPPPAQSEAKSEAKVEGFRSARFGMTEAQILKAIQTDFQIAKDAVVRETNQIEKTTSLSITVPDLIPGSGSARVIYIFGYKSKKLTQVTLLWGKPANLNPDASALITAATLLRNYFAEQGFPKDKTVINGRLDDGTLVVFRGIDEKGGMVLLLLIIPQDDGDAKASKTEEKAAPVPVKEPSLQLSYVENINSSDIFKIEKGHF